MSSEQERQAKTETVYVTPEYAQQQKQAAEIAKAKREAEQLKPLDLITEAPAGYYYEARDVEEYNNQAIEYNRKLREYKQQLSKAEMDSKIGFLNLEQYEAQRKLYLSELERTAPDRAKFLEYLKSIGPPGLTEEQKRRQAEGLPITGIPGPAAGPKPGSIGEKIQSVIAPPVIEAVKSVEETFRRVTTPVRTTSEELGKASLESARRGDAIIGEGQYLASVVLGTAAMAFDIATFEYRPQLWADVGRTIGGLAFEPDTREAFVEQIIRDPFRFGVEMAGGAYLGARLQRVDWVKLGEKTLEKTVKGAEWVIEKVPQEDPFRGMSQLDRYLANQPYKVRTFLEGPAKTMYTGESLQSPRLSAILREAEQAIKIRPIPKIPTEFYKPSASLYVEPSIPSLTEIKFRRFLRTLEQEIKLKPIITIPTESYRPLASLYAAPGTQSLLETRARILLRTIEQEIKLRPEFKFPSEIYKPSATLYTEPSIPSLLETRTRIILRTIKQELKLRPEFKIPTEIYKPSATLGSIEPSIPSTLETRLRIMLRTAEQELKLRPGPDFLLEKYGYEAYGFKIKHEPFQPYYPSFSEQVKALEEYSGNTYIARTEAFMRRTFTPEKYTPTKPISVASLETVSTTKNLADAAKATSLMIEEADRSLPVSQGPPGLYAAPPKPKKAPSVKDGWAKLSSVYFPKMSPQLSKQLLDLEVGIKTKQPQKLKLEVVPTIKIGEIEKNVVKNLNKVKITSLPDVRVASLEKVEPISISRQELKIKQLDELAFKQVQVSISLMRSELRAEQLLKPKKKKKRRRGRKEAWELRADKILKFEFKEPKIKL